MKKRSKKSIIAFFISFLIVICIDARLQALPITQKIAISASLDTDLKAWSVSSLETVSKDGNKFRETHPNLQSANSVTLYGAKGEYESFQIVVQSPENKDLRNINISISDLQSQNQQVIESKNITLYREHYIYVDKPIPDQLENNPTFGSGWYPDALIPFEDPVTKEDLKGYNLDAVPFNLVENENQPIWVDIFVPSDVEPGAYQGSYTVTTDTEELSGAINLNVWDFELPKKSTLKSHFLPWKNRGENVTTELLKHKITTGQEILLDQQTELINNYGLNLIRLPFWSGADYHSCTMSSPPSVEQIREAASLYDDRLLKFVYSADEVDNCPGIIQPLKAWANNIRQAGVKHLVVMNPRPELYDDVDIWVVQPDMYETGKEQIEQVIKNNKEVWFYPGYNVTYSPQWAIDAAPINFRISQGFIAPNLNLTGILYPRIDAWTNNSNELPLNTDNPWYKPSVYQHGDRYFSGEGLLIYPGSEVGVEGIVPSIRLKRIRDGIEDYEYVSILNSLGEKDWALNLTRTVASDWSNWTQDTEKLEAVRVMLGEKIQSSL